MSLAGGGCSRRGGGGSRFELPWQQPPVVVGDVGCNCRTPRLLSSLISSLKSHARGVVVGKPKQSSTTHASSSSWSSSATKGSTSSTSITTATTTFSSLDHQYPSWGRPTTCAENANANAVYEVDADAEHATRHQRRQWRRRRQRRPRSTYGRAAAPAAALGEETAVAVEVESAAPYEDFRESMVQMVTEKEMYAWEDLNALLQQFLALNSPRHHPLIVTAFADLWASRSGPFCPPSPCL